MFLFYILTIITQQLLHQFKPLSPLKFRGTINDIKKYETLFFQIIQKVVLDESNLKKVLVKLKQNIEYEDNNLVTLYMYWKSVDVKFVKDNVLDWVKFMQDGGNIYKNCGDGNKLGDKDGNVLEKVKFMQDGGIIYNNCSDKDANKSDGFTINDNNYNVNNIDSNKNCYTNTNSTNGSNLNIVSPYSNVFFESYCLLLQGSGDYDVSLYQWFVFEILKREQEEGLLNIYMALINLLSVFIY